MIPIPPHPIFFKCWTEKLQTSNNSDEPIHCSIYKLSVWVFKRSFKTSVNYIGRNFILNNKLILSVTLLLFFSSLCITKLFIYSSLHTFLRIGNIPNKHQLNRAFHVSSGLQFARGYSWLTSFCFGIFAMCCLMN